METESQRSAGTPRVVVGVDEDSSEAAVRAAADEAVRLGGELLVVSAYDEVPPEDLGWGRAAQIDDALRDRARVRARKAVGWVREGHPDLVVSAETVHHDAVEALVHCSESATLVVTGSRRLGTGRSVFLGSVSSRVAATAHCPVLVVPFPPEPVARNVVVAGLDATPSAKAVLAFAFTAAERRHASLELVTCARPDLLTTPHGVWARRLRETVQPKIESMLAEWRAQYPAVDTTVDVVVGTTAPTLVAKSEHAALLVVGKRGRPALLGSLLGSVSQGVLHHARCPVAVVPT